MHTPRRLFIAIDLPLDLRQTLASFQPQRFGLRAVAMENMHLTLHFLGMADASIAIDALSRLDQGKESFELRVSRVGYFYGRDRNLILWAGIEENIDLSCLHAELAELLRVRGFKVEARAYHPHITLARGVHTTPQQIGEFLQEHNSFAATVQVSAITLYSSELTKLGPKYCPIHEHRFGNES